MFDALLNEYRAWRDIKIQQAFENPIEDAEALKEYVDEEARDFHYQYSESITLRQYKLVQRELMNEGQCVENIVNEPLVMWCVMAISEDDWDTLFQENEPQTESDSDSDSEEEQEAQA
jgi:Neuraminidase (sialidase)